MTDEARDTEIQDLKDRLQQLEQEREQERQAAEDAARQRAYGNAAAGGTAGGYAPVDNADDAVAFVHGRLRRGEGLNDAGGKIAFARMASQRLAEAFEAARDTPNYKATSGADARRRK